MIKYRTRARLIHTFKCFVDDELAEDFTVEIPEGFVKVAEAAAQCNVGRRTMHDWIKRMPGHTVQVEVSPGAYQTYVNPAPFLQFKK